MTQLDLAEHDTAPIAASAAPKLGRPMDVSRDADILDAALDVLAAEGYDGMTIDMVAAKAKAGKATLYRRWPSKTELVLDAVACMKNSQIDYENLPDTGTLRGDLVEVIKPMSMKDNERKLHVMAGMVSLLARNPEFADIANKVLVAPRRDMNLFFLRRAIERGEIPADTDIHMIALISASMVSYHVLMMQKPADREFLIRVIDSIVLPAVGLRP